MWGEIGKNMSFRPRPATTASLVDVTDGHTARLERVLFAGMGNAPSRPLAIQFKAAATPYKELSQQVTDVGACVPRTFDPDYCAYDSFYFMGVTVVSALSGALMTRSVDTLVAVGTAIKQGMGDALIARGDNTAAVQRNSEYYADADKAQAPSKRRGRQISTGHDDVCEGVCPTYFTECSRIWQTGRRRRQRSPMR